MLIKLSVLFLCSTSTKLCESCTCTNLLIYIPALRYNLTEIAYF